MKWCPKCSQHKDATEFNKNKARPSGLSDYCKACMRLVLADHRQRNAERLRTEGRERAKRKYAADPESARQRSREWRLSNPGVARKSKERTYQKYRDKNVAYARQYASEHADEIADKRREHRLLNLEEARERDRIYYEEHTDIVIARKHRLRARKAGSVGEYTANQWHKLIEYYAPDGKCLNCRKVSPLTVDHVIPLTKGGSNFISNLQCLCSACNTKKKDQTTDYRPDKGLFAQSIQMEVERAN